MLLNAASLVATFVVKSGFGFAYWWLAARQFSPTSVGFASAAVSAMTLLATLCMLGLGTLLIRELPRQSGQEAALISAALLLVALAGGCIGLLFAVGMPSFSADFLPLRASLQAMLLFAFGVGFATVNLVLDQVLIGLLWGDLQLWRNLLFASGKLAFLAATGFLLAQHGGLAIYATWALGDVFSLIALIGFVMWRKKWNGKIPVPHWALLRKLGPSALQHHLINLIIIAPNYALPILVTTLISAETNAWFYIAFLIADVVYVVPQALVMALYAISASQPDVLARRARLTILLTLLAYVLANVILFPGAPLLLGFFGSAYAAHGVWVLRFLALAALPFFIKELYIAICRIQDRIAKVLLPLTAGAILEIIGAIVGAHFGNAEGLSLGWFIAISIEAVLMLVPIYRIARPFDRWYHRSDQETTLLKDSA